MSILIGVIYLIFLCSSILILALFAISQYQKKHLQNKNAAKQATDYYRILFDVYE